MGVCGGGVPAQITADSSARAERGVGGGRRLFFPLESWFLPGQERRKWERGPPVAPCVQAVLRVWGRAHPTALPRLGAPGAQPRAAATCTGAAPRDAGSFREWEQGSPKSCKCASACRARACPVPARTWRCTDPTSGCSGVGQASPMGRRAPSPRSEQARQAASLVVFHQGLWSRVVTCVTLSCGCAPAAPGQVTRLRVSCLPWQGAVRFSTRTPGRHRWKEPPGVVVLGHPGAPSPEVASSGHPSSWSDTEPPSWTVSSAPALQLAPPALGGGGKEAAENRNFLLKANLPSVLSVGVPGVSWEQWPG